VTQVTADGPADNAGLKAGDVVTAINGTAVTTADGLQLLLQSYKVGDQVQVTYYRGSSKQTATVTLAKPHNRIKTGRYSKLACLKGEIRCELKIIPVPE
jgi:serine protease Do